MSPNLNDSQLLRNLCIAAKRGVHVKLLIPKDYSPLASFIDRAGNYISMIYRSHLPKEFQKNFEVRWFSEDGQATVSNHSKYYAFDGCLGMIGSLNGDNQSTFSRETLIAIKSKDFGRIHSICFEQFWDKGIAAKESVIYECLPIPGSTLSERVLGLFTVPMEVTRLASKKFIQRIFFSKEEMEKPELIV